MQCFFYLLEHMWYSYTNCFDVFATNSTICVIYGNASVDLIFLLIWIIFSYSSSCLVIFLLDAGHSEFFFDECWMFFLYFYILKLCSGMQLYYLETVWFFPRLAVKICDVGFNSFFKVSIHQTTEVILLNTLFLWCPLIFSTLTGRSTIPSSVWAPDMFYLLLFSGASPQTWIVSHNHELISSQMKNQGGPSVDIWSFFSVQLPLHQYSLLWIQATLASLDS